MISFPNYFPIVPFFMALDHLSFFGLPSCSSYLMILLRGTELTFRRQFISRHRHISLEALPVI